MRSLQEDSQKMTKSINQSQDEDASNEMTDFEYLKANLKKIKFVTLTVACSARMSYHQETWDDIKESLNDLFETLIQYQKQNHKIIICLNVHNKGKKLQVSKYEKINDDIYK